MRGHVMPSFTNSLIGLGPFVDMENTVVFTATSVSVVHPDCHSILDGWREAGGAQLWRFPLEPTQETPANFQEKPDVAFTLPTNHVDKDSAEWRKVTTKRRNSGAVLPDPEDTQEDSPEPPTTPTPSGDTTGQVSVPIAAGFSTYDGRPLYSEKTKRPHKRKPRQPLAINPLRHRCNL
jgi:hypothetical protein